ncbi:Protein FAM47E [Myotis davidii]|uniref:Protein FAM47E n=1 Tax=Myotis davidii TaxID=225400 RepID=L5MH91_MYODS|nr:Protein FAM47E [Myotis davidii]
MNTQRWVFVKKGLDDFRYGCPSCENMITRGLPEHPAPQRYSRGPRPPPTKRPSYLPMGAALCSRLSAAQQARKSFLEEIEAQLTRHPLARYPDLEESMPLEVITCPRKTPLSKKPRQSLSEEKPSAKDSLHKDGPTPNENVRKSVRDFCDWAASIGSSRIDEEYIMKQFDINYERGVSHNTLRPMKLGEIPGELRKGDGLRKQQESEFFQELEPEPKNTSRPKHVKMRYGSWYQHPKLWKRQRADEPLIDPKALHKDENLREEQKKQEEEFAKLHGPAAFKDFILRKGYRMPSVSKGSFQKDLLRGSIVHGKASAP